MEKRGSLEISNGKYEYGKEFMGSEVRISSGEDDFNSRHINAF